MKKFIMFVNLADDPNLPEDINNLPPIRIIRERGNQHRTIGLEQITEVVLELEPDLEQHSEYIPFRVEIWEGNEPDAPPIQDRRRRRGEDRVSSESTTPPQEEGGRQ